MGAHVHGPIGQTLPQGFLGATVNILDGEVGFTAETRSI
jgi:hypothetical protein